MRLRLSALPPCSTSPTSCSIDFVLNRFESIPPPTGRSRPTPGGAGDIADARAHVGQSHERWLIIRGNSGERPTRYCADARASGSPSSRSVITATERRRRRSRAGARLERDAADGDDRQAARPRAVAAASATRVAARPRRSRSPWSPCRRPAQSRDRRSARVERRRRSARSVCVERPTIGVGADDARARRRASGRPARHERLRRRTAPRCRRGR